MFSNIFLYLLISRLSTLRFGPRWAKVPRTFSASPQLSNPSHPYQVSHSHDALLREVLTKDIPSHNGSIVQEKTYSPPYCTREWWNAPFPLKSSGLVLCQDLVQVKMSFSHSNLPAIPKLPVDTIFQNHRVTYNRNDYEFVWYYKTFPSIQIPGGMHVCNC